ncbi:MAG: PatB family C-S lyase [Bacillota bacterium]|nr:PatB family C-S lyase [Bacillota bacterium]
MRYDFDRIIDRKNTCSLKWDCYDRYFGEKELLPMWVADMDFAAPEEVIDALTDKARFGIYGYTEAGENYYLAAIDWLKRKHNWIVEREWLHFSPGVVPALHWLVKIFTEPGDKVILQPPVYYPFFNAISNGDCQIVNNPLKLDDGLYSIDFDDLEKKIDGKVKMLFLCSPHNPGGIVWDKEDLEKLGSICMDNDVMVISDEIHADLTLYGYQHVPFASISDKFALNSVTCVAPSKTFNLAGLQVSNIIIPNPDWVEKYKYTLEKNAVSGPNLFAIAAAEAAYNFGDQWLDELTSYIEGNHKLVENYLQERIPALKTIKPRASYLAWIDCRELGMATDDLKLFMEKRAKLGLNQGYIFGEGGEGFVRMNLGCSRKLIEEALNRLEKAINSL